MRWGAALGILVAVGICAYFAFRLLNSGGQGSAGATSQQDPPQQLAADNAYVDSVYMPIAAIGDLMRYELLRPGHMVDSRQFDAILRLAKRAQAAARTDVPPGWQTIGAGFEDRTTDIVDMWPAMKWLRANCTFKIDPNAPQGGGGANGLHCPSDAPTVYMHQGSSADPIDATNAYDEVIWGYSVSYAAAWTAAGVKDPQINTPEQVNDVLTQADGELEGVVDWNDYRLRMGPSRTH